MFECLVDFELDGCKMFDSYQVYMGAVHYAKCHGI